MLQVADPARRRTVVNDFAVKGIHHVQLAMPKGGEEVARAFFTGLLGLGELVKPSNLAAKGGVWFKLGSQELHLGVEEPFSPALKAHPAILVSNLGGLRSRLESAGCLIR